MLSELSGISREDQASADLPRASVEGEKPTRDVIRIFKASLGNSREILLGALREAGYNIEGL